MTVNGRRTTTQKVGEKEFPVSTRDDRLERDIKMKAKTHFPRERPESYVICLVITEV